MHGGLIGQNIQGPVTPHYILIHSLTALLFCFRVATFNGEQPRHEEMKRKDDHLTGWSSGNVLEFYSGDALFESR
jgi:hypothetical protein